MKKYAFLGFIGFLHLSPCYGVGGPIPLPSSSNQFYYTNPVAKMTPQQKTAVGQVFSWAQTTFQHNHAFCKNRTDCLNKDLGTLVNFINLRPTHPAHSMFKTIYNIIRYDAQHQKFVTQWVIFKNLSPERQAQYQQGIRVTPIRPRNVKTSSGASIPAFFNQDDVFTDLLQAVEHHHKNCEGYASCLRGDLQTIERLHNRLGENDPVKASLGRLGNAIRKLANEKRFNTSFYLNLYNPLTSNWGNTLKKQRAKKISAYGYNEWQKIQKSSRPTHWKAPRITNQPSPNLRSTTENMRSNVQNFKATVQEGKKAGREWWNENQEKHKKQGREWWEKNKDLFKGWW